MQDTRLNPYFAQHDLERLFDELRGALFQHQPPDPVDFLIDCLNAVGQKKRESREPLQYSTLFSEYVTRPLDVNGAATGAHNFPPRPGPTIGDVAGGSSRKRQRPEDDHYMNRTPPYNDPSPTFPQPQQSNEDVQQDTRHPSFASLSPPRQNLSNRFFQHQPHKRERRNSVSAESIKPSEHCNTNIVLHPKDATAKRQIEEATQNNLLFRNLDKEIKAKVLDAMFERRVEKGEIVIHQGDEGDNFYVVTHGMFEISVNGRTVLTVADGGSFGELALMYNTPRAATVKALTDGILWAVDRTTFLSTITTHMYRKRKTYEDFLRSVTILKCLQQSEITKLADALEPIDYKHGETIVFQGDPGEYFYIIEKGYVNVWKTDASGNNKCLPGLTTGQYFGELALIDDKPRSATVVANGPVSVVALKRDAFDRLLGPVRPVMESIRSHAESYDEMTGVDAPSSPQQQPSPPENQHHSVVDESTTTTRRKSGYSGAGGVDVL